MPILEDILKHQVIGREYQRGREEGREEGRYEGELAVVRRLLEKRFGELPEQTVSRLRSKTSAELETLGLKILDAATLEELSLA